MEKSNIRILKNEIIKKYKHQLQKDKVFIYGAFHTGQRMYNLLESEHIKVEAFFVDEEYKTQDTFMGLNLYSKSEVLNKYDSFNTVIGFYNWESARDVLNDKELNDKGLVVYIPEWEIFSSEYWLSNKSKFENNFDLFKDKKSKDVYDAYLDFKINGYPSKLIDLKDENQYFDNCVIFEDNEVFLDIGGYIGDTTQKFIENTKGKYKKIFIFEPDPQNIEKIDSTLKNVEIIQKGAWNSNDTLYFSQDGSSSNISSNGSLKIEVTTIDDVLKDYKDKVTFIKMDIEGAELQALQGAEQTIKKYMPKLAICVYHKIDDMLNIPQYINKITQGIGCYDFYLRHYSNYVYETVLYAIPRK